MCIDCSTNACGQDANHSSNNKDTEKVIKIS